MARTAADTAATMQAGYAELLALRAEMAAALERAEQLARARRIDAQRAAMDANRDRLVSAVRAAVAADDEQRRLRRELGVVDKVACDHFGGLLQTIGDPAFG